ncbi:response regulator [Xylanimonas ulmi]|uniref:Transcriptional regulatory protein n=1 Tax=Xylanimonas ulmi TaxID=228973 RepID=A0A4V2EYB3_9MICO|nr:response regulator [Xylanibacterium ulmi]RZS62390.1 response regulator of citrate/malate metabolism [Xylanibacterium ulmi]
MTAAPGRRESAPLRVLVVEDDPAVADLHRRYVDSHPRFAVVGAAATGSETLRLAAALRPDVVLLDVHLPDGDGLDVLTRLRTLPGPPADVVAATAASEADAVRRAMAGGVAHYLVKPFTAAALRERLDAVWAARERLRQTAHDLGQDEVDRLLARGGPPAAGLPKGIQARSLTRVEAALGEVAPGSAGLSSSQVAAAVGMSRVSARRYLEHLVDAGRAEVEPRYGATGRPENVYRTR